MGARLSASGARSTRICVARRPAGPRPLRVAPRERGTRCCGWLSSRPNGQYSVRYESQAGPEGELKVEIRRKDTKARVGRSVAEISTLQ